MNPKTPLNGFSLIDSAERSQTHPETWGHPDGEALGRIAAGYFVKVGLDHPARSGERFWGVVKERTGHNILIEVSQDMILTSEHGIQDKDIMSVTDRNVFGIIDSAATPVWQAK